MIDTEVKLQKFYKDSGYYHESKVIEAIHQNPKFVYSYAKKRSKVKTKVGPLLNKMSGEMTQSEEMAEILADQYSTVFSLPSTDPPEMNDSHSEICKINVSKE